MDSMTGKTCIVTGATSGIGKATAIGLGKLGADIIAIGRNERRGEKVVRHIQSDQSSGSATFLKCDLSSQRQVRALSEKIHEMSPQIDVLINNAGANFDTFQVSESGIEMTFATYHLSHFLLTALLLDLLLKTPEGRIISTNGDAHMGVDANFEECLHESTFDRRKAKKRSKLANMMFTYELAKRLRETRVTVNAVHPGGVASRVGMNNGLFSWLRHIAAHTLKRNLISPRKGADTLLYMAASNSVPGISGKYYYLRHPKESSPESRDQQAIDKLWELSVKMTKMDDAIGEAWQYFKPV